MQDPEKVFISPHAMRRFAQRVKRDDMEDNHSFTKDEHARYLYQIFEALRKAEPLPTQLCLLFSRLGTRTRAQRATHQALAEQTGVEAGTTTFGEYYYDGDACYVVQGDVLRTIIVPDDAQYRTLDDWFAKQKKSQPQGPPALSQSPPEEKTEWKSEVIENLPPRIQRRASPLDLKAGHTTRIIFLPEKFHLFGDLMVWLEQQIAPEGRCLLFVPPSLHAPVVQASSGGSLASATRQMRAVFEGDLNAADMRRGRLNSLYYRMKAYLQLAKSNRAKAIVFLCGPTSFERIRTTLSDVTGVYELKASWTPFQQPTVLMLVRDEADTVPRWEVATISSHENTTDEAVETTL